MKIMIRTNSINRQELLESLGQKFESLFVITPRGKNSIVVAKNNTVGALVKINQNSIDIKCAFSTKKARVIFFICLVIFGFIIPLFLYFILFYKKMKNVEKQVAHFIKKEYKHLIIEK